MFLAQIDVQHAQTVVEQAQETVGHIAKQPLEWWMAALTVGSLICIYLVVRKMLHNHRLLAERFLTKVEDKDKEIARLNDRMFTMLEERWKTR